jgi:hypothetical protein
MYFSTCRKRGHTESAIWRSLLNTQRVRSQCFCVLFLLCARFRRRDLSNELEIVEIRRKTTVFRIFGAKSSEPVETVLEICSPMPRRASKFWHRAIWRPRDVELARNPQTASKSVRKYARFHVSNKHRHICPSLAVIPHRQNFQLVTSNWCNDDSVVRLAEFNHSAGEPWTWRTWRFHASTALYRVEIHSEMVKLRGFEFSLTLRLP